SSVDPLSYTEKSVTLPVVNEQKTEAEWNEWAEKNQPTVDTQNAAPIQQSSLAGVSVNSIEKQIVGGSNAIVGQFPWQAFVQIDNAFRCGGSVILDFWILTAAHCAGSNYLIALGVVNLNSLTTRDVWYSNFSIKHEQYNQSTLSNDIALIKLTTSITFTANIRPIKLMSDASINLTGTLASVSGYGKTADNETASNILKFTQVTVISNAVCASVYGSDVVISSTICAYQINTSICQGDSGGPLIYLDQNNTWVQIGIVSFTNAAGCLLSPSGYARVSSFAGWISYQIAQKIRWSTTVERTNNNNHYTNHHYDTDNHHDTDQPPRRHRQPPRRHRQPLTTTPASTTTTPTTTTTTPANHHDDTDNHHDDTDTTTTPATTTTTPTTTTTTPATTTTTPTTTTMTLGYNHFDDSKITSETNNHETYDYKETNNHKTYDYKETNNHKTYDYKETNNHETNNNKETDNNQETHH
ncbi:Hypothetical predicted protein, partial [Cloeon dipterum]